MELGIQIGGVLLVLMFLVFVILGRKSWKWFHMLAMFLVMAATITFCIYAALVDKTRRAHAELYQKDKAAVEKLVKEAYQLEHGDPTQKNQERGLIKLRGALWRATHGRSNVYRNCTAPAFDGTSDIVVTVPAPAPMVAPTLPGEEPAAAPPPPPSPAQNIPLKSTVYAFVENSIVRGGPKYPVFYVGEFYVTAKSDTSVTLRPSLPPLAPYRPDGSSTWAIYEEMPADRQNFVDDVRDPDVAAVIAQLSRPPQRFNLDEAVAVQENRRILQALFPAGQMGLAPDSQEYKDFIDRFRFDGWALNQINNTRKTEGSPEFDPPEYEKWRKIEFLTPEKFDVDSTVNDEVTGDLTPPAGGGDPSVPYAGLTVTDVFDSDGRAISSELRQGSQTEIDLDVEELREGVFDNIPIEAPGVGDSERVGTVDALVSAGKAKVLETVYVRKLNDFRHHFRQIYDFTRQLQTQKNALNLEIARINAATLKIDEQKVVREEEQRKLNEDKANYKAQFEKAKAHADDLEKKLAAKKANINKLIADIATSEARLAAVNQKMEEAVRRNAQAVSADAP